MKKDIKEKENEPSQDNNMNILRDKIVELEQKNREMEMKVILV